MPNKAFAQYWAPAQCILGFDFITPGEVTNARRNISYSKEQIIALCENVPSVEVLEWCKKNDYAIVPPPPNALSLLEVWKLKPDLFLSRVRWLMGQKFTTSDKTASSWLPIKKTPVANSTSKAWSEQKELLSVFERVPNVAEMCWFITTYYLSHRIRLFESVYARTLSLDSDGDHIYVGDFGNNGLDIFCYRDDRPSDGIGLSAARK